MSVFNSILKCGMKFTKNGCRLLSKSKAFLNPKSCKSIADTVSTKLPYTKTVKVETDFGKAIKTINSQMSPEGKLLNRTITKTKNGEVIEKVVREYIDKGTTRTIKSTKTGRGGILLSETEETINWLGHDVSNKGITRTATKIKFEKQFGADGTRLEHQVYETLEPGKGRTKHLETYAKRLSDGHVVDTHITGSGVNLDELAKDPYLFIRNYNNKDFAHSARWLAEKNQNVAGLKGSFSTQPIEGHFSGFYRNSDSSVVVDVTKNSQTKTDLIDILNHEYRHKYQHKKGSQFGQRFLNLFRSESNKVPLNESLSYAIKNKASDVVYPFATATRNGYLNSFLEVDARNAGALASNLYSSHSKNLASIFGGPDRMYFVNDSLSSNMIGDFLRNATVQGQPIKVLNLGSVA